MAEKANNEVREVELAPVKKVVKGKHTQKPHLRKRSKNYKKVSALVPPKLQHSIEEAVSLVKKTSYVKFDASVELHMKLGLDPKKPDQAIRGTIALPHGTGKTVKILVFAQGDKVDEAKQAGADYVGAEDLIEKIKGGWIDFDVVIATPDMMAKISVLGRILGTKGLMPNPKAGTVTMNIARTVEELRAGRIEYKLEKAPLIHTILGKVSFSESQLKENLLTVLTAILKAKPPSAKGNYLQSATINATMGPGIALDMQQLRSLV